MINRSTKLVLTTAVALAIASCGGGSEETGGAPDDPTPTVAPSDPTPEVPLTAAAEPSEPSDPISTDADEVPCGSVVTAAEVEAILGVPVEINGSDTICTLKFAENSFGSLQAWSGSKAEEAVAALLTAERFDEATSGGGIVLDDGRGFVFDGSAVAQGDSERVFRFDTPDNAGVADLQAAMEVLADLLLTR